MHTHRWRHSSARGVAALALMLCLILGLSVASAQDATDEPTGPDPAITIPTDSQEPSIPRFVTTPEATPEPQAEQTPAATAPVEIPTEPVADTATTNILPVATGLEMVLGANFEGLTAEAAPAGWFMENLAPFALDNGNTVALLADGSRLLPMQGVSLSDVRVDAYFNLAESATLSVDVRDGYIQTQMPDFDAIAEPDATADEPEIPRDDSIIIGDPPTFSQRPIRLETGYRFTIGAEGSTLLRADDGAYVEVASGPGVTALDWHALTIVMNNNILTVNMNGAVVLTYADDAPLAAGSVEFTASGDLLVDEVAVYNLSPTGPNVAGGGLDDEIRNKLGGAFANVMDAHLRGEAATVTAIADNFYMERDVDGRFRLILWAADATNGDALAELATQTGGTVAAVAADHVEVYITPDALLPLLSLGQLNAVTLPEYGVSTGSYIPDVDTAVATGPTMQRVSASISSAGNIAPHSLDIIGATSWQAAGVLGTGVDVAVIDSGFASSAAADAETADCLADNGPVDGAGSGNIGTQVVEVLCDVAPGSSIRRYRASNITELDSRLSDIQNRSQSFPIPDVIVITVDTGTAPNTSVETKISSLVNGGTVVIAAAGNGGSNGALRAQFGGGDAMLTIEASAGQIFSYSWDNTTSNYPTRLLDETGNVLDSRPAPSGNATHQYIIPASCGERCTLTLTISGDAPTTFNTRVMGGTDAGVITAVSGVNLMPSGTLTEVASLADVIAVGAVCPLQTDTDPDAPTSRYRVLPDSSIGDPDADQNGEIKPELVAPSRISTSSAQTSPRCGTSPSEGSTAGVGFDGTAASAAHVAGMSALLLSNEGMISFFNAYPGGRVNGIRTYLMTRTIDISDGAFASPDGFDNIYGAGVAQLGDPTFGLNFQQNLSFRASDDPGTWYYVTSRTLPDVTPTGAPTAPFTSVAYAIEQANANAVDTVVLMPGEWPSGFAIPYDNIRLVSFDAVDQFQRPVSQIWVNDNYFGLGGVFIGEVDGVTVEGLRFVGATPSYTLYADSHPGDFDADDPTLNIGFVTPVYVSDVNEPIELSTTNISIVDNEFLRFDAPVFIGLADGVTIQGNEFDEFALIPDATTGRSVFSTSALEIVDSGENNGVLIDNNQFTDNFMAFGEGPSNLASSPRQESVLYIERSQVTITRSRFERNIAEAVVSINHWINPSEPIPVTPADRVEYPFVVYNSLFAQNDLYGSVVQIYQNNDFTFVNNTVAENTVENTALSNIISLGHASTQFQHLSDHRFDIHNNLFYFNLAGSSADDDAEIIAVVSDNTINIACDQVGSAEGTNDGLTHNWLIPNEGGGVCTLALNDAGNNNIVTTEWPPTDPSQLENPDDPAAALAAKAQFEADNFFAEFDPTNFYRLRPAPDNGTTNPGVDVGDNSEVYAIIGPEIDYDPEQDLDLIGAPRLQDRTEPIDPIGIVDLGAYELSNPEPLVINNPLVIVDGLAEDLPGVILNLVTDGDIEGGFTPYTFEFSTPQVFNSDADAVCLGQPFIFGIDPDTNDPIATYCPPPDFYTEGVPITLVVEYTVAGILDSGEDTGSVEIRIDPAQDGAPTVSAEKAIIFTEIGSAASARLRPFATFTNNFFLSDPDEDDDPLTPSDVDYPFTYAGLTINPDALGPDGHNPNLFDEADVVQALVDASNNDGLINLIPNPGETGAYEFSYGVTDGDGENTPDARQVRIVVAERLATVGLHDDASLDFLYSANDINAVSGWAGFPYEPGINNTIHFTSGANQSTDFFFAGDGFAIYLLAFSGGANYSVQVDTGNGDGFQDPRDITGVSCSQTGGLSTNFPNAFGNFTFACSGLDSISAETVRTLRITNTSNGSFLVLDAVQVRNATGLGPGVYYNDDFAFDYGGAVGSSDNTCLPQIGGNGSWYVCPQLDVTGSSVTFTTQPGASMSFTVDGDEVEAMILHRTTYPFAAAGEFEVQVGDAVFTTSNNSDFYWDTPFFVGGIGNGPVEVTVTALNNEWAAIDYIELIGSEPGSGPGFYSLEDSRVDLIGAWESYSTLADGSSADGTMHYSFQTDAVVTLPVDGSIVDRVTVHHTNWGGTAFPGIESGALRVCGATCQFIQTQPDGPRATTIRIADLGLTGNPNGLIGISQASRWVGIDQIQLWSNSDQLGPGQYLEYHPGLDYGDGSGWATLADPNAVGGSVVYAVSGASGSVNMNVDTTTVDRVVVLHGDPQAAGLSGTATLCRDETENCQEVDPDGSRATIITGADLGFVDDIETITLSVPNASGANAFTLEAIHLLGTDPLGPGAYEHDDPALVNAYAGRWYLLDTLPTELRFGEVQYTFDVGTAIGFNVDATASDRLAIYHAAYAGAGTVCNDATGDCVDFSTALDRQTVINLSADLNAVDADVPISIRYTGPEVAGGVFGFEGIELLPAAAPLTVGLYQEGNANFDYEGSWGFFADTTATDSGVYYAFEANSSMAFSLDATQVEFVGILHQDWVVEGVTGAAELCPGTATTGCVSFNATDRAELISVAELGLTEADETVTLRVTRNFFGLDAIALIGGAGLGEGIYEHTDANLTYVGNWLEWADPSLRNGTVSYTDNAGAAVLLPVDATAVDTVTVFHTPWLGTLEVCGGLDADCQSVTTDSAAGRSSTFTITDLGLTGANEWVTVRVESDFIGFEGIQLSNSAGDGALAVGQYLYTDERITLDNAWDIFESSDYVGGSAAFVDGATGVMSFSVNADLATSLTVLHDDAGGSGEICEGTTENCVEFTTPAFDRAFTVAIGTDAGQLNLIGTAAAVEIRGAGGALGIEGVRVNGAESPILAPGLYQETDGALIYDDLNDWLPYNDVSQYAGRSIWTNAEDAGITLRMGDGATGVIVFVGRYAGAADVQICATRVSTGNTTCVDESTSAAVAGLQSVYGISIVGLPPLTEDGLADEVYTVTITRTGATSQSAWLGVDAIAVLGTTPGRLVNGDDSAAVVYDDQDSNVVYAPAPLWALVGETPGTVNGTYAFASNAGAVAQFSVDANTVTLLPWTYSGGSRDVRFCQSQAVVTPQGVPCANFSLNTANSAVVARIPIVLYGFGEGENDLIIENRDAGLGLTLDAIEIR